MIEFLTSNKEWIFSGVGVFVIVGLRKFIFGRLRNDKLSEIPTTSNINNVSINLDKNNSEESESRKKINVNKDNVRILFIDDNHKDFRMVSILKRSGFPHTKSIKDITDLNDLKVMEANIIFVDINGVGSTLFSDQGLGLASALKTKYQDKKIVLYSAETNGDRFHKALREVDGCLSKDAEPYQFIATIEDLIDGE